MRPHRVPGGPAVRSLLLLLPFAVGFAGCGITDKVKEALPDRSLDYKKSRMAGENLELPPDLKSGKFDDALDVPPAEGMATYSEYSGGRTQRQQTTGGGAVLPTVENVELRRSGDSRWLEVQAPATAVWQKAIAFWREQGILLTEQNPGVGTMKTDWIENRAEVPQDFLTRMVRKVADGLYSAGTRDQYTVRLENGPKPGVTEVHLTHRGMVEKIESGTLGDAKRSVWQPAENDQGKEAEMLRRLMLFLGASDKKAAAVAATRTSGEPAAPRPGAGAHLVGEGAGQVLVIPEEFRRGWRATGAALDRAGFAVEDRDMSRGLYFVRYQDADASAASRKGGFFSRLAFWRKDIDTVRQYQIKVEGNDRETRVSVVDGEGAKGGATAATRILPLIKEQMR